MALIASSSWSHAFLTPKNHYLYPDNASDRARFDELASGKLARWRELTTAADRGCRAAGIPELGLPRRRDARARSREPEIVDYVESYIFNSDKCFALFRP